MTQDKEEIGYAWNFQADLGNGRAFSLSGNFAKGIDAAAMNAEVDKVRSVFDRQQAQSASRGAEEEIQVLALRKKSAMDDLIRIDEKSKDKGLSAAERQQREAAVAHIDKMEQDLAYKQGVLSKLQLEAK
jgi:hypothetical protein